ncbi:DUF2442 domain-containing protein [Gracilimonas mengyeensis]|uniref:Integron cassette protein n=1 Tax=Gracilimonas mengyeensis TaxID=1302730 RepID=A0A521ANT8_9BACT|nr:DUF2442 domain-containing protein [Gracilimonas mengyeensis]SMO36472.1 Protein of unknown function [Gracilimonas mengyeensis]
MKSEKAGTTISEAKTEITNISSHGIWLFYDSKEYFLPFDQFPWFEKANIKEVLNVENPSQDHFYWPDLDVDLHLDSIKNPEKYPLISK